MSIQVAVLALVERRGPQWGIRAAAPVESNGSAEQVPFLVYRHSGE